MTGRGAASAPVLSSPNLTQASPERVKTGLYRGCKNLANNKSSEKITYSLLSFIYLFIFRMLELYLAVSVPQKPLDDPADAGPTVVPRPDGVLHTLHDLQRVHKDPCTLKNKMI